MDKQLRDKLHRVIDYLREQERKNWHDQGRPTAHIYNDVHDVWYWLRDEYKRDGLNIM